MHVQPQYQYQISSYLNVSSKVCKSILDLFHHLKQVVEVFVKLKISNLLHSQMTMICDVKSIDDGLEDTKENVMIKGVQKQESLDILHS